MAMKSSSGYPIDAQATDAELTRGLSTAASALAGAAAFGATELGKWDNCMQLHVGSTAVQPETPEMPTTLEPVEQSEAVKIATRIGESAALEIQYIAETICAEWGGVGGAEDPIEISSYENDELPLASPPLSPANRAARPFSSDDGAVMGGCDEGVDI